MHTSRPLVAAILAAGLTLTACGGSSSDSGSTKDEPAATSSEPGGSGGASDVTIADFAYDPVETEVKVGESVTFTNEDDATHTATAEDGDPTTFDTGELGNGDSKEVTFDEAGDYEYYCSIHEYMKGTVRVVG